MDSILRTVHINYHSAQAFAFCYFHLPCLHDKCRLGATSEEKDETCMGK